MAYCSHCGTKLDDSAKFCSGCGTPVVGTAASSADARKTHYDGELFKCPSCGALWNSLDTKCSHCGYEKRGAKAVATAKEFYEEIAAIEANPYTTEAEKQEKILSKVRYFPIPNTKEDLFEFISMARARMNRSFYGSEFTEGEKELAGAWAAKYEELYLKAKMSYGSSTEFAELEKIYVSDKKEIPKAAFSAKVSDADTYGIGKWGLFVICLLLGIFGIHKFVERKFGMGILYLFTCGLFFIGWLTDLCQIATRKT